MIVVVSGVPMEREVFILPTGESFVAWDIRFGTPEQHVETAPATEHDSDGSSSRNGTAYITVETAEVEFCTCPGSLHVAQKGQLSSAGDQFFEVTISAIEPATDRALVTGRASRHVGIRFEWER